VALMPALIAIAVTGAMFLLGLYVVRAQAMAPSEARLRRLGGARAMPVAADRGVSPLRRDFASVPALRRLLGIGDFASRLAMDLERADLQLRPGEFVMMRLLVTLVAGMIPLLIFRSGAGAFVGVLVAAGAYALVGLWLRLRIRRRRDRINKQIAEAVALIANALRAGFAFSQALDNAASRIGPPLSQEFGRALLDINLGASPDAAMEAMNRRIDSDDMEIVVSAVLIQRTTGGNLADVLDRVSETIRDRERIYGEIKTLTASQQFTGWVLALWPAVLALAFVAIAPDMMKLLWTTGAGRVLLVIWLALNVSGAYALRRILAIKV
jgi:tight adherence protein B